MSVARWALGFAFAAALVPGALRAETGGTPGAVAQTGYEYDTYLSAPAPASKPAAPKELTPPPAPVDPAVAKPAAPELAPVPAPAAEDECPAEPKPWTIPQPCLFQKLGIKTGGWIQQGITFNADKPADRFNGPIVTNDRDREWQMNQAWLYLVRPTKTDGCGWDLGGRVDLVYGSDWRFGQTPGLEDRINGNDNFYGWVFPQFYMEAAVNDLTIKMGHFATLTSYEVIPAVGNFFYSHTYTMGAYLDPLLVTGMQAEYKLNDNWMAVGGFNRGWMMYEDFNDDLDFLGGVKWRSDDKRTTASFMLDTGAQDPAGENNRFAYFAILTHDFNEKLTFALQHDYGFDDNGAVRNPGNDAEWYSLCEWLVYKINPKWSAGARFEWVRDDDGARIAGVGNWIGSGRGWLGGPGFAGNLYDITLGLNWMPHPNFRLRPEIRWDWYDGTPDIKGMQMFDGGTKDSQFTAAMDLLVTF